MSYGRGPKPKFSGSTNRRQEEAELTDHVDLDYNAFAMKKDDVMNTSHEKRKKLFYPNGDQSKVYQITEGALVFNLAEGNIIKNNRTRNPNQHGEEGQTVLNGVNLTHFGSHLDFTYCINPKGISKSSINPFGEGEGGSSGLAITVSGGKAINYSSKFISAPKEKAVVYVPPLSEAAQSTQRALRQLHADADQITPLIKPLDPDDVAPYMKDLLLNGSNTNQSNNHCKSLETMKKYSKQRLVKAIVAIGVSGIRVLLDRGICALKVGDVVNDVDSSILTSTGSGGSYSGSSSAPTGTMTTLVSPASTSSTSSTSLLWSEDDFEAFQNFLSTELPSYVDTYFHYIIITAIMIEIKRIFKNYIDFDKFLSNVLGSNGIMSLTEFINFIDGEINFIRKYLSDIFSFIFNLKKEYEVNSTANQVWKNQTLVEMKKKTSIAFKEFQNATKDIFKRLLNEIEPLKQTIDKNSSNAKAYREFMEQYDFDSFFFYPDYMVNKVKNLLKWDFFPEILIKILVLFRVLIDGKGQLPSDEDKKKLTTFLYNPSNNIANLIIESLVIRGGIINSSDDSVASTLDLVLYSIVTKDDKLKNDKPFVERKNVINQYLIVMEEELFKNFFDINISISPASKSIGTTSPTSKAKKVSWSMKQRELSYFLNNPYEQVKFTPLFEDQTSKQRLEELRNNEILLAKMFNLYDYSGKQGIWSHLINDVMNTAFVGLLHWSDPNSKNQSVNEQNIEYLPLFQSTNYSSSTAFLGDRSIKFGPSHLKSKGQLVRELTNSMIDNYSSMEEALVLRPRKLGDCTIGTVLQKVNPDRHALNGNELVADMWLGSSVLMY